MTNFYRHLTLLGILIISSFSCNSPSSGEWNVKSPNGNIISGIKLEASGKLSYNVTSSNHNKPEEVIEWSPLGIVREDQKFDSLQFLFADDIVSVDENYTLKSGKRLNNHNTYNELTLHFDNFKGSQLNVVFRVYDEGVAFKYVFPENDDNQYVVTHELTGFKLPKGLGWMQPYDSSTAYAPAYERNYEGPMSVGTEAPFEDGWCFPALFEVNNHWVLITEANLKENFYGSHLNAIAENGLYILSPPKEDEAFGYGSAKAFSTLPWEMPWRVITVGKEVGDIVESNLVFHTADKPKEGDFDWVKPGRASWGWWSGYLDRSKDTPEKLKKFIDFAQIMGWEYSLVDAGWDTRKGLDIAELAQYAKDRGIGLLLWYNSGGPINKVNAGPRDLMFDPEIRKKEMQRISELGVKGIKVDFFASDKQDFIKLYLGILKDAAEHKLLVNFHGCTIPRGWSRTFPNMISYESVKGSEAYIYHSDFEHNAPLHNTVLPFTRNVVGSMDYTPAAFSMQQVPHKTSYGHELALSVVFESGIQHFPDKTEVYLDLPGEVRAFLQQVPASWDKTKFLSGYPGKEAVIARQKNDVWFIGGINGEDDRKEVEVSFNFLDEGEYEMMLINDGEDSKHLLSKIEPVGKESTKIVEVLPIGGFVMKISKK